jgi:hypothetical protein
MKVFEVERRDVFMLRDILPGPRGHPIRQEFPPARGKWSRFSKRNLEKKKEAICGDW